MRFILLVITINICAQFIYTCSCPPIANDLSKAFALYTNIFKGTVLSASAGEVIKQEDINSLPDINPNNKSTIQVFFNQITSFKGNNTETTNYITAYLPSLCGYNFIVGQTYLVYANVYGSVTTPSISTCSPTKIFDNETNDNVSKNELAQLQVLSGMNYSSGFLLVSNLLVMVIMLGVIFS